MFCGKRRLLPVVYFAAATAFAQPASVDPTAYLSDVKFLASPEMRGRASGSPELEKAAAFIAGKFREFGIHPVAGKQYLQPFSVTTGGTLGSNNHFEATGAGGSAALQMRTDFVPFNISSAGRMSGRVVFAGFGITAPEYKYDDYAGVDVKGKIVLILRHEPQEFDEHSVFAGKEFTKHATFFAKASNAKNHGAVGIVLVNDVAAHKGEADDLPKFGAIEGPSDAGIPFVQIKADRADAWLRGGGKSLERIEQDIDGTLKPESFALAEGLRVNAQIDIERAQKTVNNVVAYLPGETAEYVVIGAHYDHLGLGEQHSLAPSLAGTVHPGADDNASGTAGVIELARWFAKQPKQKRGILFLTFAGEEMGLLGSAWYVAHPELPLDNAVAMLNMDMIGRLRSNKIFIGGANTGTTLRATLDRVAPKHPVALDYSDTTGEGSSDHVSFAAKQVPALFFFSGLHSDYHKPSDTWDKIDAAGAAKVLSLVADVADDLRESAGRPAFVRAAPAAHGGAAGPVSSGTGSGYGPYFGSIPDFGEGVQGVKFADVREGSPAAKAGFKGGDVMVQFDGKPIQNLYDFTYALQSKKPGDEVAVKVLRDGKPVEATVLLTKRQ
jgi:Zn-dependent M28 family amino/carboxypeptidase